MHADAMKRICVFCGSNTGVNPSYRKGAMELGRLLATRGLSLVYGGGAVGLMGILADAALKEGGQVVGVIPAPLASKEVAHPGLSQMHVVSSMHERKALMAELSDAFIAMPGGYGTFEELFETITWVQLGIHRKTVGLLNLVRYFDPLIELIDNAVAEGFIHRQYRELIAASPSPLELLDLLATHQLPQTRTWISSQQS